MPDASDHSFLSRIKQALSRPAPPPSVHTHPEHSGSLAPVAPVPATAEERVARFQAEFERVAGVFHRAREASEAQEIAVQIAREREVRAAVTWPGPLLGRLGIGQALGARGIEVWDGSPRRFDALSEAERGLVRERLAIAELGITEVDHAVADSGSLILFAGPGRGRLASALPLYHLAVVRPEQILGSLDELPKHLRARPPDARGLWMPSAIAVITGPSRSADIELSLTRGVHGPREVHVLLWEGA
jgi:L-lactate dehydrogenase complex protein LldG